MKICNLFYLIVIVFICSCSKTPEDKMKENLTKYMKNILFIPASYKPAKFEIKDTIYAGDLTAELDSLNKLNMNVKDRQESFNKDLEILENAYENNQYHNLSKLKEMINKRDEIDKWIKHTTYWIDSLLSLCLIRTGDGWIGRNPHSIMFYKVFHTYEAKRTDGNMGVSVAEIYFDTTYQIYSYYKLRY